MSDVILVTGGTGKTGARLAEHLVGAGQAVRVASRSGQAPARTEGISFDWFKPEGHRAALAGVRAVYLVAPIGSDTPLDVMEPFIEQAISQGVRRFVLLSSSLIKEGGPAMGAVHALLALRAPEWAVLQPSWFMENFTLSPHLLSIRIENAVYTATDDGLVPFIAVNDIAEVAFRTLTSQEAPNDGLVLTGPEAISYATAARIIGAARGADVQHYPLHERALMTRLEAVGVPARYAAMLAALDRAIAAGAEARTTDAVQILTGRPPLAFEHFVMGQGDLWKPPE